MVATIDKPQGAQRLDMPAMNASMPIKTVHGGAPEALVGANVTPNIPAPISRVKEITVPADSSPLD